jgi:hypothetical protein
VAYLDRLTATHKRSIVSGIASRLNNFAGHLAAIETYLTATAEAVHQGTGMRRRLAAIVRSGDRDARSRYTACLPITDQPGNVEVDDI